MTLAGYTLLEDVARTSRAHVVRMVRDADGVHVIVKTVQRSDRPAVQRCHNHYDLTKDRPIRGVVRALDLVTTTTNVHLVMEDAGPLNLRQFMERHHPDVETALDLVTQIASALDLLHAMRMIHRDISVDNIVVRPHDLRATIADLGLSVVIPPGAEGYASDAVEGSLDYIAPEQTGRLQRLTDSRSDLYSLGGVLYHVLCGKPPFEGSDTLEMIHAHLARSPRPPHAIHPELPKVLSQLVMTLLAKDPDERYQSAFGLAEDLRRIRRALRVGSDLDSLPLEHVSTTVQFRPPKTIVGRELELDGLNLAFSQVHRNGAQLYLLSGTAGSGKSSIADMFLDRLRGTGALVAKGKFDQFTLSQPLAGLTEAIGRSLRGLLRGSTDEVNHWRAVIAEAVDGDAAILRNLIPEITLFGVETDDGVAVGAREARIRLAEAVVRLVKALAGQEVAFVIAVEDLHWADEQTFDVINALLEQGADASIFIVGTYRTDEDLVSSHPLFEIQRAVSVADRVHQVEILPLGRDSVQQIISASLDLDPTQGRDLTDIVMRRTNGVPLFVQQFLAYLVENGIIRFDRQIRQWTWTNEDLAAVPLTFNVQDVILARFDSLPQQAQDLLSIAACVGPESSVDVLVRVSTLPYNVVTDLLDTVVASGLMHVRDIHGPLRAQFAHDRVQQIALESVQPDDRVRLHASIAKTLMHGADSLHDVFSIYDLAHHLMEGQALFVSETDRRRMVEVLLEAAHKARTSGALRAGFRYAKTVLDLLGEHAWRTATHAMAQATLIAAECAGGIGQYETAHELFDAYVGHTDGEIATAQALALKAQLYTREGRFKELLETNVRGLKLLNVNLTPEPSTASVGLQLVRALRVFSSDVIERHKQAPFKDDERLRIADELLFSASSAGYNFSQNLLGHITISRVLLAYESGHGPTTVDSYANFALVLMGVGMVDRAVAIAGISKAMIERTTDDGAFARTSFMIGGHVAFWTEPIERSIDHFEQGLQHALRSGSQFYVYWGAGVLTELLFVAGRPLSEIHAAIQRYMDTLHKVYQRSDNIPWTATYFEAAVARVIQAFDHSLEAHDDLATLIDGEVGLIDEMRQAKDATAICSWSIGRLRIAVAHWDTDGATSALKLFDEFKHGSVTQWTQAEVETFGGLACAQSLLSSTARHPDLSRRLGKAVKRMEKWAKRNPETFGYRHLLLKGAQQIVVGEPLKALETFRSANTAARQNGNMHFEAMAMEWSAVAAERTSFAEIASVFRDGAARVYRLWGAISLAERLEQQRATAEARLVTQVHRGSTRSVANTATISVLRHNIDVDSIFKASSAISGEIVHEELVRRLLAIVLENAGANIGALIMDRNGRLIVEASSSTDQEEFSILNVDLDRSMQVCRSAVHLVARTGEPLVIESAIHDLDFAEDEFIKAHGVRSLMVVPVLHQGKRIGLLHLVNTKAPQAFTPERIEVIRLLTSQIAVSLENARLYAEQRLTLSAAARFIPTEFLDSLGIPSIRDVHLGDAVNVQMTVLFADIRRFTSLSETMTADETFAFLNEYLAAVSPAIRDNHGFIDKYVGDAIMALFPNRPEDAVRASVEIHRGLAEYNRQRAQRGYPPVFVGIGLHYGEVMLGTVGTDDRMDTTVIGDTVNIAARLEELTKERGAAIYLSDEVYRRLPPGTATVVARGEEIIRGRVQPLQLHEITLDEPPAVD